MNWNECKKRAWDSIGDNIKNFVSLTKRELCHTPTESKFEYMIISNTADSAITGKSWEECLEKLKEAIK